MTSTGIVLCTILLALLSVTCYGRNLYKEIENENLNDFGQLNDPQYPIVQVRPGKRINERKEDPGQWYTGYVPERPGKRSLENSYEADPQYPIVQVRPGKRINERKEDPGQWYTEYVPERPGKRSLENSYEADPQYPTVKVRPGKRINKKMF